MSLFLLFFLSLYGGIHFYAFTKARAAFSFGVKTSVFLALFMSLMFLAPIIVRLSEKAGYELFARFAAYAGYIWIGVLFLFFSCSLLTDLYRLLISLGASISGKDYSDAALTNKFLFMASLTVSLLIAVYGFFEARDIRTEKILIRSPKIPSRIGVLKIAQISDVHLGLIVREDRLARILREVKNADPDILVSTGDLVDGQIDGLGNFERLLLEINPRYGKFAVTGNHEFFSGLHQALDFTKKAGFTMLRGKALTVAGIINIAGVDDPAGRALGFANGPSEKELLSGLPREKFTLLLKHRPLAEKDSSGLFDLQLSGHTHKGQIFPFSLVTKMYYPSHAGFKILQGNSALYVSRGSGTWGPPIRFLSPPEVTIIELVHAD